MPAPESDRAIVNSDPLLSMRQAADYLGVSTSTMYEIAHREKFPIVLITRDRKIRRSILDEFIKQRETYWQLLPLRGFHS
jgi:excisionase family DNA binding protein